MVGVLLKLILNKTGRSIALNNFKEESPDNIEQTAGVMPGYVWETIHNRKCRRKLYRRLFGKGENVR